MTLKKGFFCEDLSQKAGIAPNYSEESKKKVTTIK